MDPAMIQGDTIIEIYNITLTLSDPQYRLGNPANLPEVDEKYEIYNPTVSSWIKVYALFAGVHANALYEYCLKLKTSFTVYEKLIFLAYFIFSGTSAGGLMSGAKSGHQMEAIRFCIIFPYLMWIGSFGAYAAENVTMAMASVAIGLLFIRFTPNAEKAKTE